MRLWIAATQSGLFLVAMFFIAWASTALEQKAAEQKFTMMRTARVRELNRAFYLAAGGFTITTSAFLVACVLLVIS